MRSTTLPEQAEKANVWLACLAFIVAAFALFQGRAGAVALVLMTCGFALVLTRLCQERDESDRRRGLTEELARARELLARGAHGQALATARRVVELAHSARLERAGAELVAWCELDLGRPGPARNALSWLGSSSSVDPYCRAAVEAACGQERWALHILERAARRTALSREATLLQIDLNARVRGIGAACSLTLERLPILTPSDVTQVVAFARRAGYDGPPLELLVQRLEQPPSAG